MFKTHVELLFFWNNFVKNQYNLNSFIPMQKKSTSKKFQLKHKTKSQQYVGDSITKSAKNKNAIEKKSEDISWDLWERILYTPHLNIDIKSYTVKEIKSDEDLSEKDLELIWNSTFNREFDSELDKVDWKKAFRIEWIRIVQIAKMTNFYQKWWVDRLYDVLKKMKIHRDLVDLWAKDWDVLLFSDHKMALKFREEL